mmetsp:Transcript_36980/g.66535  ORF Transcript_36980/g.66535 Transcript_36980/m.66535 type:complete len:82 (+) Transcript_36980:229-474(+)
MVPSFFFFDVSHQRPLNRTCIRAVRVALNQRQNKIFPQPALHLQSKSFLACWNDKEDELPIRPFAASEYKKIPIESTGEGA